MALLKLSGLITKISGKMGGSILGTSPSGSYLKQNSYSQNPNTPKQSIQKNKIGVITQLWRSLTPTQQTDWLAQSSNYPYINRLGDQTFYNGFQLFNKLNMNLQAINLSPNLSVPPFVAVVNPNFSILQYPAYYFIFSWSSGVVGTTVNLFMAPPSSSQLNPKPSTYLLTKTYTLPSTSGSIGIQADYENIFGTIPSYSYISAKIKTYDTNSGNVTEISLPDSLLFI